MHRIGYRMFANISRHLVTVVVLMLMVGCARTEPDFTDHQLSRTEKPANFPQAQLRDIAWISNDVLAFSFQQWSMTNDQRPYHLGVYHLDEEHWRKLNLPDAPSLCIPSTLIISNLLRTPDDNLAFTFSCHHQSAGKGPIGQLYVWNPNDATFNLQRTYDSFLIGTTAFSPEMDMWIQESRKGAGLNNELYLVEANGSMEQILSDFQRVSSPSWSRDGQSIIFGGTQTDPTNTNSQKSWRQIEGLLLHPWDLYQMDSDGLNPEIVFLAIGAPYQIRRAPDNQRLFFAGRRPTTQGGIWSLDLKTKTIIRLWPYNTFFDISPDGNRIVIIEEERKDGEVVRTTPVIYELPVP